MADQSSVTPSTDPTESKPVLLKMSEVYRQTGVDVDALKMLIEDDLLVHGVERGRGGHVYVKADSLPTYDALLALLREQLVRELRSAQRHMRRVELEMEAVRNDLELALEDLEAPLGHDLLTVRVHTHSPRESSLSSALSGLEFAAWAAQRYQAAVKRATSLAPFQID